MEVKRNYGIDLSRFVFMFMICLLHVLGQGGILNNLISGSKSYYFFWLLEVFCFCAVDGFAIISGYVANDKPQKYEKIINIWFQMFFYSFIVSIILMAFGFNKNISISYIVQLAFPIIFNKFWYITAYFALFLFMPVLNKFIFSIDKNKAMKSLIIIFIFFILIGFYKDCFKTSFGYSAIWLITLYLIGGLAKKADVFKNKKSIFLIFIWALCIISTWSYKVFLHDNLLLSYISPTILLSGLIMVILFSRLNIKKKTITSYSPYVLGIFLFQANEIIWNDIIKDSCNFIFPNNALIIFAFVMLYSCAIFICGFIIDIIRSKIFKVLRIHKLSEKLVICFNLFIDKFANCLR